MRSRPRTALRDNSKNITLRLTEEQDRRLRRYMALTCLTVSAYFRKLIRGDRLTGNPGPLRHGLYAGINKIHSNVMQIARCRRAKELDPEAVAQLLFLADRLCEEVYLLTTRQ